MPKGIEFSQDARQMVVHLKNQYDLERTSSPYVLTKNSAQRVADGLGLSISTVKRIISQDKKGEEDTRTEHKKGPEAMLSDSHRSCVRQYVRTLNLSGSHVSIDKILTHLKKEYKINIHKTTLWRSLKQWDYEFGEGKRKSALKEKDKVLIARQQYLREKIKNREEGRPEVYLDETYINMNHSTRFTWYWGEDGAEVMKPSGKGRRLIIMDAIMNEGWVKNARLIFEAKRRTGDYHGQMDWDNFSKWFQGKLVPNIPKNAIIVLDNASYHNQFTEDTFPLPSHKKEELLEWLFNNNVSVRSGLIRPELFELCKKFAPLPSYKLDSLAKRSGHTILRTPPYHPELQPIEKCWAIVKNHAAQNSEYNMEKLRKLLPECFAKVTEKTCSKLIDKMREEEDKYMEESSFL